jgi:hypothetical protein
MKIGMFLSLVFIQNLSCLAGALVAVELRKRI